MTAIFACAICIVACNLVRCSSQNVRREKYPVINRSGKIITLCTSRLALVTARTRHKFRQYYGVINQELSDKPLILRGLDLLVPHTASGTDEFNPASDNFERSDPFCLS